MNRLMLLGLLLISATAQGLGTLQLGEPKVEGNRITIPVLLGGDLGVGVSAMDFRFRYNPAVVQPISVVPGASAVEAQKRVMSNLRTPGEYSVVMMGFNQSSCGAGEAIEIVLQRLESSEKDWGIGLAEATMSNVDGSPIDSEILPALPASGDSSEGQDPESDGTQAPKPVAGNEQETGVEPALSAPAEIVMDAVVSKPAEQGASNAAAARNLKTALEQAAATRAAIGNPEMDSAGNVRPEGRAEQPAGEQNATQGLSGAVTDGERMDSTGSNAPPKAENAGLNTVEHESLDRQEPAGQNAPGKSKRVVYGAVCVTGLLAVGLVLRRMRLFG